jgi:hypothetical protein
LKATSILPRVAFECGQILVTLVSRHNTTSDGAHSQATNETTGMKGQYSANQGMNVQEAIPFPDVLSDHATNVQVVPLVRSQQSRLLFGS